MSSFQAGMNMFWSGMDSFWLGMGAFWPHVPQLIIYCLARVDM